MRQEAAQREGVRTVQGGKHSKEERREGRCSTALGVCVHAQSCPTLWDRMDGSPPVSSVRGIFPGNNTGVGCHFKWKTKTRSFFSQSHLKASKPLPPNNCLFLVVPSPAPPDKCSTEDPQHRTRMGVISSVPWWLRG